jgi:hypothetical protein
MNEKLDIIACKRSQLFQVMPDAVNSEPEMRYINMSRKKLMLRGDIINLLLNCQYVIIIIIIAVLIFIIVVANLL